MYIWNLLHVVRWKYRTQKIAKNLPSVHHRATLSSYIFATKAFVDNGIKVVKQQYLLHMFSQYGELRPISVWDRFTSLGHPSKFQWVLGLGFVTALTSLNGRQPHFARCLAVSWSGTLYIHFRGLLPLTVFSQVQNSLSVQVLHSRIFAALLHDTRLVGVSPHFAVFSRGCHLYSAGHPSRWASAHILVLE